MCVRRKRADSPRASVPQGQQSSVGSLARPHSPRQHRHSGRTARIPDLAATPWAELPLGWCKPPRSIRLAAPERRHRECALHACCPAKLRICHFSGLRATGARPSPHRERCRAAKFCFACNALQRLSPGLSDFLGSHRRSGFPRTPLLAMFRGICAPPWLLCSFELVARRLAGCTQLPEPTTISAPWANCQDALAFLPCPPSARPSQ